MGCSPHGPGRFLADLEPVSRPGASGDLFNPERIQVQLLGIGAAFVWAFPLALVMYWYFCRVSGRYVTAQKLCVKTMCYSSAFIQKF